MKQIFLVPFSAIILFFLGCSKVESLQSPLYTLTTNTGIHFTNHVTNRNDFNIFTYRNFYNGGGAAIGDINNDGFSDVLFTANQDSSRIFLNKGNWHFDDITASSGIKNTGKWATGVVLVDINNDGWLDIYICYAGFQKGIGQENELYINNHNNTFTEKAKEYGLANTGYTTHAAFFDYDLDGDLDCYILNNSFIPVNTLNYANKRDLRAKDWPVADFLKGGGDQLLRNDNGKFTDVSEEAGIYGSLIGFGLGITIGDVNGDLYPDIYVSNDFFEKDYLYINQKDGTFKEDLENCMQHISASSMGADIGDVNNDGYPDIFTTDMLPDNDFRLKTSTSFENIDVNHLKVKSGFYNQYMQNTLQVNNKNGHFLETSYYSGVAASDWSWGGLMLDADNDGFSDIFVCNGIYYDVTDQDFIDFFANDFIQKMVMTGKKEDVDQIISKMPSHPLPNKMFRNIGNLSDGQPSLKFTDEATNWGLAQPSFSNGAAYGDLDNDGDLDLIVNNVNQPAFIYQSNSRQINGNSYISVLLKGKNQNTYAVGSKIFVYSGNDIINREVMPSRGFQSSVDYKQIIGLGKRKQIDSMVVVWPDRTFTTVLHPAINKFLVVEQPAKAGKMYNTNSKHSIKPLLTEVKNTFKKHIENDYIDFYTERNLPEMLSREGPHIAKGDVNGDGLEDIFIGGAKDQTGQLYIQTENGFVTKNETVFTQYADFEDVAVLFFDADRDGDLDLFVGSGGNTAQLGSRELLHRLYKNDGRGNFTLDVKAFPFNSMNISIAVPYDYDGDGDLDLFVGSRSVPMAYGLMPESYLYNNDGHGHFTDVAKKLNENISHAGMVTGAVWADVDGDNKSELIITGEWMATKIFSWNGKIFKEMEKTGLEQLNGWWQSIAAADVNNDGKMDLVIGNIGDNFYLHPTANKPVKMWLRDYDQSGTVDQFITKTVNGKDVPVFLKKEIVDQFPILKKQNLKNIAYAEKSVQDLFGDDNMKTATVRLFNYSSSIVALNVGNGVFQVQLLPVQIQLSNVNAICTTDIDNNGKTDLILGGNSFNFPPQFGRLDASYGHLLINSGNASFKYIDQMQSGLNVKGETKDIKELSIKGKKYYLFTQNNGFPMMYLGRK